MIYYFLILCFLITVFYFINRKKPTNKTKYIFEDNISNLNEKEKTFWLLLSLYRNDVSKAKKVIKVDKYACEVAREHSEYMSNQGKVTHDYQPNRCKRILDSGAYMFSEIVTAGESVDVLIEKFKSKPKHNAKMLNLQYNACGISIVYKPRVNYITVIFIRI